MIKRGISLLLMLLAAIVATRCAHPVMPTGGDKDETPPKVLSSVPQNYTTNFKGKTIVISFDEFVKLDKLQQQLLISPPTETTPDFKLRGKSLVIKFEEELKPETTYAIYFGEAIVDLTESNPLTGFSFVFSTGAVLDSMSINGSIHNAFDRKPAENTFAMLYLLINDTIPFDSLPYRVKPYYVARTDKFGKFRLTNLKQQPFKLFALTDMNSNFIYDMAGESIAFIDSLISPVYIAPPVAPDTLIQHDSLQVETTAAVADSSLNKPDSVVFNSIVDLNLFEELDPVQKLLKSEIVKPGMLRFIFRHNAREVRLTPMAALPDSFNLISKYNTLGDTLYWFFRPMVLDSLKLTMAYDTMINDTLALSLNPRQLPTNKRLVKKNADKDKYLQFTSTASRRLEYGSPLEFVFDYPIVSYQLRDTVRFIANEDTTYNSVSFVQSDSIGLRYRMETTFEAGGSYNLLIPDSCFLGLNGQWNDTIRQAFKVPALEDYGNLYINMVVPPGELFIIQLLGAKEVVLREIEVSSSKRYGFEHINPGKYKLKAIRDSNRNKRWDTGNYLLKMQPESVYYFTKELEIRANWDFEENWNVENALSK